MTTCEALKSSLELLVVCEVVRGSESHFEGFSVVTEPVALKRDLGGRVCDEQVVDDLGVV